MPIMFLRYCIASCLTHSYGCKVNPLVPKDDFSHRQCVGKKTKCHLMSLTENMQSNWLPFKFLVFCRVH
jgi:hypothetical protein